MPETVATVAATWAYDAGASAVVAGYVYVAAYAATIVAAVYTVQEQQRRAKARAMAAYNDSLQDRYTMVRSATEPRRIVLGKQRVSGPLAYIGSYGANREKLVYVVNLAAHEIAAIHTIYFNGEPVVLDADGTVLAVLRRETFTIAAASGSFTLQEDVALVGALGLPSAEVVTAEVTYGSEHVPLAVDSVTGKTVDVSGARAGETGTLTLSYWPKSNPFATGELQVWNDLQPLDGSGNATITLTGTNSPQTLNVYATAGGRGHYPLDAYATFAGGVVTVTGAPYRGGGWQAVASYSKVQSGSGIAKVRKYLGGPTQVADFGMQAALPGIWTAEHKLTGIAYVVVELTYNQDAYQGGQVEVSAEVDGALLYDPRTGLTAFSENPSLMMRYVALSPLLGRQPADGVDDIRCAAEATVCDTVVGYVVDGQTYTRPLYTAGLVVRTDQRASDALDDLAQAMAGRWCVSDGRVIWRAGRYATPIEHLDETWLADTAAETVQCGRAREDTINVVTGRFANGQRDYQVTDFPRVDAEAYIAQDGGELPLDVQINAVTFQAQAQQVMAAKLREERQTIVLTVACNMRAFRAEALDFITVSLARFGWVNKPFEVLETSWSLDGIVLQAKEVDPTAWDLGLEFSAEDPAPNTSLPQARVVPDVLGLLVESGEAWAVLTDYGVAVPRMHVRWTPITDAYVLDGGGVEVRFGRVTDTDLNRWGSVKAVGGTSEVLIPGLQDGESYYVQARAYTKLANGPWCDPYVHDLTNGQSSVPALAWVSNSASYVSLFFNAASPADSGVVMNQAVDMSGDNDLQVQATFFLTIVASPGGTVRVELRVDGTVAKDITPLDDIFVATGGGKAPVTLGPYVVRPGAGHHTIQVKVNWLPSTPAAGAATDLAYVLQEKLR